MKRLAGLFIALVAAVLLVAGCTTDGRAISTAQVDVGDESTIDTDRYENVLLECQVLAPSTIARVVGGSFAQGTFVGAICRWMVSGGGANTSVTFTWFESGSLNGEKATAKELGYQTENIRIASQTAFTQVDPERPETCGVTANAPSRGIITWWVEPPPGAGSGDPCAAPTELMELLLTGGH